MATVEVVLEKEEDQGVYYVVRWYCGGGGSQKKPLYKYIFLIQIIEFT